MHVLPHSKKFRSRRVNDAGHSRLRTAARLWLLHFMLPPLSVSTSAQMRDASRLNASDMRLGMHKERLTSRRPLGKAQA